ncbi:MAG TPA: glycosyltransferase family 2 protein [Ilumatobacteraceae bacterium]
MRWLRPVRPTPTTALRVAAGAVVIARLARATRAAPPVRPTVTPRTSISVVIPARDEAERIGPLLDLVVAAPRVDEVIVVDDGSSDATAALARAAGAHVVEAPDLPDGWTGKAWALQHGIIAAAGEWVVALDADSRPDPRLPEALVARAMGERLLLATVAGRFPSTDVGLSLVHPAMLTTLVYRYGAPGSGTVAPGRLLANGQCMAVERAPFLGRGGMAPVAGHPVEDVALARHLASLGERVAFLDASELLRVDMYRDAVDALRGWSRSLALPGVEPRARQLLDAAVVLLAQVLPLQRLVARRGDAIDLVLALVRLGTLAGTARAYERPRRAYWLSPLADGIALLALCRGIVTRRQTWRGRQYVVPPARSADR